MSPSKHNRYLREIDQSVITRAADASGFVFISGAGYGGALPGPYATLDDLAALDARKLSLTGGTLSGALILADDPSTDLGAATKQYVDNLQYLRIFDDNGLPILVVTPSFLRLGDSLRPGVTYTDNDGLLVADLAITPRPGWEWSWYLETPAAGHAIGAIFQARRACRLAMVRGNCKVAPDSTITIEIMKGYDYFYIDQLVNQITWPAGIRTVAVDFEDLLIIEDDDGTSLVDGPEYVIESETALDIEPDEWVCLDWSDDANMTGCTLQLYFEVR